MTTNTLLLIDGSSIAYRSHFALMSSGLRTAAGLPTWAITGFFNNIFELIETFQPRYVSVFFDVRGIPTFRHKEFEHYKAHRPKMPDDLATQWPLIKDGVQSFGMALHEVSGYEADDCIGTVARIAVRRAKRLNVLISTNDHDSFQLIDERVHALIPTKEGLIKYSREEVFAKVGVWPEQIADYKGLVGDSSDNIPGVLGIGPKNAKELLAQYATIENLYSNLAGVKPASLKAKLESGTESAQLSKRLATICTEAPVEFDMQSSSFELRKSCGKNAQEFCKKYELNALSRRLESVSIAFAKP